MIVVARSAVRPTNASEECDAAIAGEEQHPPRVRTRIGSSDDGDGSSDTVQAPVSTDVCRVIVGLECDDAVGRKRVRRVWRLGEKQRQQPRQMRVVADDHQVALLRSARSRSQAGGSFGWMSFVAENSASALHARHTPRRSACSAACRCATRPPASHQGGPLLMRAGPRSGDRAARAVVADRPPG